MSALDPATLTPRQRKVHALMQDRLSESVIAAKLGMTRGNVRSAVLQVRRREAGHLDMERSVPREAALSSALRCKRCFLLEPHECLPKELPTRRGE